VKIREETEIAVSTAHATWICSSNWDSRSRGLTRAPRDVLLDGVAVTLDVLEFGWYVELEGPLSVLPEMSRSLGFDPDKPSVKALSTSTQAPECGKKGRLWLRLGFLIR